MDSVIRVDNAFYVLASSRLSEDRSRVLKYGNTFAVLNRLGDIESIGLGEHGIYHKGTRYLSQFALKLGCEPPQLLRSSIRDDNAFLTVDAMNVDISEDGQLVVPRGSLHIFRSKFLDEGICHEHVRLANYSLDRVETSLSFEYAADYRDIFEVRGTQRERRGKIYPPKVGKSSITFCYEGLDNVRRGTQIEFSLAPHRIDHEEARFRFSLEPKAEASLYITTLCMENDRHRAVVSFDAALQQSTEEFARHALSTTAISTSDHRMNEWFARSAADLQMMIVGNPEGAYPYGGVPWFSTVFGRDGIITAMECLWIEPRITKSVLRYLAETQATTVDSEREAQPGKIIHEMRHGEMAALNEVPFGRYYGSVDATPLFVMLAGDYLDRTDDKDFLRSIWPNLRAALNWIDQYGDADGDGFVEYHPQSAKGLIQQGWKDSHDAISYADGRIAEPPIALCEVQGYVYAAKLAGARLAMLFDEPELAAELTRQAGTLKEKFNREFWDSKLGTFALALDGHKNKCLVKSSNPGHCLFSGIATPEYAGRVAESLLGEELFCGWGIRTLGGREVRYNPMSYHNGSVWPHDNAIAARGLARYGFHEQASKIFSAIFEASEFMEMRRLPELFCGFHKRQHAEGPTLYPVACSPQSWAAGSVYMLLHASLGIRLNPLSRTVTFGGRSLPPCLQGLTIRKLRLGDAEVDLEIEEYAGQLRPKVLRQMGTVTIGLCG